MPASLRQIKVEVEVEVEKNLLPHPLNLKI